MCRFSKAYNVSITVPFLYYHSMQARDYKNLVRMTKIKHQTSLEFQRFDGKGTTKYVYYHPATVPAISDYVFRIDIMELTSPYMLTEGSSCLYGGVYIVQTLLNKDIEILSRCTSIDTSESVNPAYISDLCNVSIVIILYNEYSTRVFLSARYMYSYGDKITTITSTEVDYKEDIISITVPNIKRNEGIRIYSYLLKLRKVQSIDLVFNDKEKFLYINLFRRPCTNIVIFYLQQYSTIMRRKYDQETSNFQIGFDESDNEKPVFSKMHGDLQSIFLNMSACNLFSVPKWKISIQIRWERFQVPKVNATMSITLPQTVVYTTRRTSKFTLHPFWVMVHIQKPQDVPPSAIWRIWIQVYDTVFRVLLEVHTDNESSLIYGWNHFHSADDIYITVNKTVNLLFESNNSATKKHSDIFRMHFTRHFVYNNRITKYNNEKTPQQRHFTFYNQR